MGRRFVSQPIDPLDCAFDADVMSHGEPSLPGSFRWHDDELHVASVVRTWRSTKDDRGDTYLKRHWFECRLTDGRSAIMYFDRQARRGAARWWLYSIEA